jgi:hypothetical protein
LYTSTTTTLTTDSLAVLFFKENIYFLSTLSDSKGIRLNICLQHLISFFSSRSAFDNLELLKDGVYGALVTGLIIGVHEIGHILVARDAGIKLGVPYFVPSWQVKIFTCLQLSQGIYHLMNSFEQVHVL